VPHYNPLVQNGPALDPSSLFRNSKPPVKVTNEIEELYDFEPSPINS